MSDMRGSDKPGTGADTIIDAKVEPIGRLRRSRNIRIAAFVVGAIIVSVAIGVGWQLWSTGRLDLATLTGAAPEPKPATPVAPARTPAQSPAQAPAATAPGAIAAKPAAADALARRVDDLDRRMAALTDGLDRLEQVPAGQTTATVSPQQLTDLSTGLQAQMQALMQGRLQEVGSRLDAIDKKLAALQTAKDEQAADRIVVQQRMDEFDARLKAAVDNRAAALRAPIQQVLAWSDLRDRARRGLPFAAQLPPLAALADKAGGDAGNAVRSGIAALQPFAETGVPSLARLTADFTEVAARQSAAFHEPAAEAAARPWWRRAIDKVAGLVSVRRIDAAADAATPDGKLALAGTALQAGDLQAAAAALDGMTLVPAAAEWQRQAAARLQLDAALEQTAAALQAWFAAP